MLSAMRMPTLLGEKTDSNEMDRIKYVNWAVRGRPGGYWNGHLGRSNGRLTLLGSSLGPGMAPTYQPFVRKHNHSCVYYGVRGNHRSQYMFDNSCVLDGAFGALPEAAIQTVAASLAQASLIPDMVRMMAILGGVPPEERGEVGRAAAALGGNAAQITSALAKVGAAPAVPPSATAPGSNKLLIGLGLAAVALGTAVVVVRRRRRLGRTRH